jgi:hypothetical protein
VLPVRYELTGDTALPPCSLGRRIYTYIFGDMTLQVWASQILVSRIWLCALRNRDPKWTALVGLNTNFKLQTHPLVKKDAPHQQNVIVSVMKRFGH